MHTQTCPVSAYASESSELSESSESSDSSESSESSESKRRVGCALLCAAESPGRRAPALGPPGLGRWAGPSRDLRAQPVISAPVVAMGGDSRPPSGCPRSRPATGHSPRLPRGQARHPSAGPAHPLFFVWACAGAGTCTDGGNLNIIRIWSYTNFSTYIYIYIYIYICI